ncbi:hypothetical protein AAF712_007604 [Marasmius tenuissimus]|uniref:Uncharacterized protein n=1 Tax=Marasmius tenuissimus TaxID=585030 RepID=A0ABR2ZUY1_9AGAR
MTKSSASSVSSKASRPRRPPSPVSLYGAGGFGAAPPKQPRPLVQVEKKPKPNSVSHRRTPSTSTGTSRKSDDSGSTHTGSSGSIRSIESLKNFGIPGWRKKRAAAANASSLPTTPNPQGTFDPTPSNKPLPYREDEEYLRSEAENLVRQLDKATRTFGERVPVEYILRKNSASTSASTSSAPAPQQSLPILEVTPVSDTPSIRMRQQRPPIPKDLSIPEPPPPPSKDLFVECLFRPDSMVLPSEDGHDPDSPVLPSQDYHYVKNIPTLPPISTTTPLSEDSEPEEPSPIFFSRAQGLPEALPPPPSIVNPAEDGHPERTIPLLLRQPRPKVRSPSTRPATSHAAPSLQSSLASPSVASVDDSFLLKTSTPARQPLLVRPKTSHAGFMAVEASPAYPRPDSPFQNSTVPFHAWLSTTWPSEKEPPVVRQDLGQGWSGEWNRSDMQDVISQLRQLK